MQIIGCSPSSIQKLYVIERRSNEEGGEKSLK